jgi:hypothetical protein
VARGRLGVAGPRWRAGVLTSVCAWPRPRRRGARPRQLEARPTSGARAWRPGCARVRPSGRLRPRPRRRGRPTAVQPRPSARGCGLPRQAGATATVKRDSDPARCPTRAGCVATGCHHGSRARVRQPRPQPRLGRGGPVLGAGFVPGGCATLTRAQPRHTGARPPAARPHYGGTTRAYGRSAPAARPRRASSARSRPRCTQAPALGRVVGSAGTRLGAGVHPGGRPDTTSTTAVTAPYKQTGRPVPRRRVGT